MQHSGYAENVRAKSDCKHYTQIGPAEENSLTSLLHSMSSFDWRNCYHHQSSAVKNQLYNFHAWEPHSCHKESVKGKKLP